MFRNEANTPFRISSWPQRCKRQNREIVPIQMVGQIEHSWKTSARRQSFVPSPAWLLRCDQITDPIHHWLRGTLSACRQREQCPSGLGRSALRRNETALFVTNARFAPSTVEV